MKKSQGQATTAKDLEEKFDRDQDVRDYFDVRKARIIDPQSKSATVVREKSKRYRKKR